VINILKSLRQIREIPDRQRNHSAKLKQLKSALGGCRQKIAAAITRASKVEHQARVLEKRIATLEVRLKEQQAGMAQFAAKEERRIGALERRLEEQTVLKEQLLRLNRQVNRTAERLVVDANTLLMVNPAAATSSNDLSETAK
jgi:predicted  nucleic acid-binding Zn-ribbon protein